jgi:UDP-GlcNAc:undecaprenyl-phosphate GlcNAc-1-phosphate transferase
MAFSIAAICAFALSPLLFPIASGLGAIDIPSDSRRMHKKPTPRIGGIAVFGGFLTAVLFSGSQIAAMLSGGIILVSIGLVDDIYRIDAYRKLVFQIIAAVTAVAFGVSVPAENRILSTIVSIAWLVILPNAFNLIDGLDGLCGRTALVSALALFFMGGSYPALALAGALLGFLPFNLHPARMFLGDTGSLFIGFALGVISLKAADGGASHAAIALIFALPLADMSFAFFRRILNGKSPFAPDRAHFHHKLVDRGFLHTEASMLLSLVALALCSLAILI